MKLHCHKHDRVQQRIIDSDKVVYRNAFLKLSLHLFSSDVSLENVNLVALLAMDDHQNISILLLCWILRIIRLDISSIEDHLRILVRCSIDLGITSRYLLSELTFVDIEFFHYLVIHVQIYIQSLTSFEIFIF